MTKEEVFEQIKAMLVDQLGVDEEDVKMEASFQDDLDADSLELSPDVHVHLFIRPLRHE